MSKLFRRALFGYNKKDVQKYVEEISANFSSQLSECNAEIERLQNQRAELDKKRAEIEDRKNAISEAIISAQEKGEKIISEAREKAEKERMEMAKKITNENQKLIKMRREIMNMRRSVIKTLNSIDFDGEEAENIDEI